MTYDTNTVPPLNDSPIFISFYTLDTSYEQEWQECKKHLNLHRLIYWAKGIDSKKDWVNNLILKPRTMLEAIETFPGARLVWIDSDARVRRDPLWLKHFNGDLAIHTYRKGTPQQETLASTIGFRANEKVAEFIREWIRLNEELVLNTDLPVMKLIDQCVLARMVPAWQDRLMIRELPEAYCRIFDSKYQTQPPVIEQMQASRRFRDEINLKAMQHAGQQSA